MELKPGAGFGEKALSESHPRAATILCKTDCYFAAMNKLDYLV